MMQPTKTIDDYGTIRWKLPNGMTHREDGPASIHNDGTEFWYINNKQHREDGPAIIFADGKVRWHLKDLDYSFDRYCSVLKAEYGKTDEDIMLLRMKWG